MAVRFRLNFEAILDTDELELAGGTLTFYRTGTTTLKSIYTDEALTTPATNPYTLDSAGEHGDIWCDNAITDYRVIVKDSNGATVPNGDIDPVFGFTGTLGLSQSFDLPVFLEGKPSDAEVYPVVNITRDCTLPTALIGTVATISVHPTAAMTITINKNGSFIGTIVFSTGGVPTVTFIADVSFVPGDQFSNVYQGTADATGAGVAITYLFLVT